MKHAEALVFVVALLAKRPESSTVLLHFNERTIVCETYVAAQHRGHFRLTQKGGKP